MVKGCELGIEEIPGGGRLIEKDGWGGRRNDVEQSGLKTGRILCFSNRKQVAGPFRPAYSFRPPPRRTPD